MNITTPVRPTPGGLLAITKMRPIDAKFPKLCADDTKDGYKRFQCKLRMVFPWNRHTETMFEAKTGSTEQYEFLRDLGRSVRLTALDPSVTVRELEFAISQGRMFRTAEKGPELAILLPVTVKYICTRNLSGSELRAFLHPTVNSGRYPEKDLFSSLLPNT